MHNLADNSSKALENFQSICTKTKQKLIQIEKQELHCGIAKNRSFHKKRKS